MGGRVSRAARTAVNVVSTVGGAIVDTVESTIGLAFSSIAAPFELALSFPLLGAILRYARNIFQSFFWGIWSIPDIAFGIFGFFPEKRMRILVIIQSDGEELVAHPSVVLPSIQGAIDIFKAESNVRILPVGSFKYSSPFQDKPTANPDYIIGELNPSDEDTLDVDCGGSELINDVGLRPNLRGSKFNLKLAFHLLFAGARRMIGYGTPVAAFAVRSFISNDDGCSLGPLTDYVTIKFSPTTGRLLAHELGHACNLWHTDDENNLMNRGGVGTKLGRFQKINLRASRHVTYF